MKYGKEIITVMAARPTTAFKMSDLMRRCVGQLNNKLERKAAAQSMRNVLQMLVANGSVTRVCTAPNSCKYQWSKAE